MIPMCEQGMAIPLNEKKPRTREQRNKKTHGKPLQIRLVLSEKAAEMKKGSLLPARKKTKDKSVSTPMSMFSGAGLALACTDFWAALWLVQGHSIVSMRVNDFFCLLCAFLQGWAWWAHLKLCEKCGDLLQLPVPIFTPYPGTTAPTSLSF